MAKIRPDLDKLKAKYEERQKKHEKEPAKLLEVQKEFQGEMMKLYKENGGFNPLGGCLPLLAQFPVLIALYWTFSAAPFQPSVMTIPLEITTKAPIIQEEGFHTSKAVNYVHKNGSISRYQIESDIPKKQKMQVGKTYQLCIHEMDRKLAKGDNPEITQDQLYWRVRSAKGAPASMHPEEKELIAYKEANKSKSSWFEDAIHFSPFGTGDMLIKEIKPLRETDGAIAIDAILFNHRAHQSFAFIHDLGHIGIYDAKNKIIHWDMVILIGLLIASFWLSSKTMSQPSSQMPSLDPAQEKAQKQMQNLMPIFFSVFFIFLPLPSAVFLYFLVSNLFQIVQTVAVNKWLESRTLQEEKVS